MRQRRGSTGAAGCGEVVETPRSSGSRAAHWVGVAIRLQAYHELKSEARGQGEPL